MKLSEKIDNIMKEVGLVPMVCLKSDCLYKKYYDSKNTYCNDEIPYVKDFGGNLRTLTLCLFKIEDYYKKY